MWQEATGARKMGEGVVFEGMTLVAAFGFLLLGLFLLIYAASVWKEYGMERAKWIVVSDVFAFGISILFWLFWFFC